MTLFDTPKPAPLPRPPAHETPGRAAWMRYVAGDRQRCEHCVAASFERWPDSTPIRQARQRRVLDGASTYLCDEHARYQRELDGEGLE
jgi:hypothetical protein